MIWGHDPIRLANPFLHYTPMSSVEELYPGDHTALFYRTRNEQLATVIPYIRIGLQRNERCLYVAGDTNPGYVIDAMEEGGIDVSRAQREGRLTVATPAQTYLRQGIFEPQRMMDELKHEVEESLDRGFSAFRGTGELGWAAALPSALRRLYDYENQFDADLSAAFVALCQYDETLFGPDVVSQMLRIHPKVIARGKLLENPFYLGPSADVSSASHVTIADLLKAPTSLTV
jgi:hypothetical protein